MQRWRETSDLGSGRERSRRNRQARFLDRVGPSHDVGQRDVGFQLDLGRGDYGLGAIVSLAWDRNDGLGRELGISFAGLIIGRPQGIERRKVFGRTVIDNLRMIEGGLRLDARPQGEQAHEPKQESHGDHVISGRFKEAVPRKAAPDENVRPKRGRGRAEFKRRQTARQQKVAQIAEENPGPGRQFDKEPQNGRFLGELGYGSDRGHIVP